MKTSIQSLHFDADHKLIDFIEKKCEKLDQYYNKILDSTVILKIEKDLEHGNKSTEMIIRVPGNLLVAKTHCKSFEEGVDQAAEQIQRQLVKYKEKQKVS